MTLQILPIRERTLVLSGLVSMTALSWAYMWSMARDPMAICMVNMNPWSASDLTALFIMWFVMMIAMMIPSASPMIFVFARVNRTRRTLSSNYASTAAFVLGYLSAWGGFSLAATIAQEALHSAALISSTGVASSRVLGSVLLVATGVFQWTPLKNTCLRHCRSPLGFFLTEWREGISGAWRMGFQYGGYCIGCCWLIMGLLFFAGVMNLWWVGAIATFVLLEKVTPFGPWIARATGVLLIFWGVWMFTRVIP